MKMIARTAAAAMLLTLPMTLAACGGSGSKPSKADVKAGYEKAVKASAAKSGVKVPDSLLNEMSGCIIDKSYDEVSADSLNSIKKGKTDKDGQIKVTSKDKPKFEAASKDCQAKYKNDIAKSQG